MPFYAVKADMVAYVELLQVTDDALLDRYIERGEADVDRAVGDWTIELPSGRKFGDLVGGQNPKALTEAQKRAVRRATCAAAEYRIEMKERFFRLAQHEDVTGPDFTTKGTLPKLGEKIWQELVGAGLIRQWQTVTPEPEAAA